MKAYYNQIQQILNKGMDSFYFIYGSPENLVTDTKEIIESEAIKQGFQIEKYFADSSFDLNKLISSLENLGLFHEKRLIEIHILGNKLPKKVVDFIMEFLKKKTTDLICIIKASLLKNADIPAKLTRIFASKGVIIPIYELKSWQIEKWFQDKSEKLGLDLSDSAKLKIIKYMYDSSESGHQILTSLQLAHGNNSISEADISFSIDEIVSGNIFNLIYFCLNGDINKALDLYCQLQKENIDLTILLWHISTEIKELALIAKEISDGTSIKHITSKLSSFKKDCYLKALPRLTYKQIIALIPRLSYIDKINKGTMAGNAWLELEEVLLILSGYQILPAFMKIKLDNNKL